MCLLYSQNLPKMNIGKSSYVLKLKVASKCSVNPLLLCPYILSRNI